MAHANQPAPSHKPVAEVWPSRLALEQRRAELGRAGPGGLLLGRRLFTFEGRHGLLRALCAGEIPAPGRRPLPELAGPLLLHRLLRDPAHPEPLFSGVALGRRLPHRLWRLLVQVRAAGLNARDLAEMVAREGRGAWPRLAALARLLGRYEAALADLGLADEADLLAELLERLADGRPPGLLASWSALEVRATLWLRPLDLRLLGGLARALPVTVRFALFEPPQDPRGVYRLLRVTAEYLESGAAGAVEVSWEDAAAQAGPLSALAEQGLGAGGALPPEAGARLELTRAPGRYAEVEGLVRRAWELVERGVPHHEIALVFPDLALCGPMAADAAARLGLGLSLRRGEPLPASPLVQAFLALLELPLGGLERQALARVWQSPYLGPALARVLRPRLGAAEAGRLAREIAPRAGRLLARAGYVDARETPVKAWLERAAGRDPRQAQALNSLGLACACLYDWLRPLSATQGLADYARRALAMVRELGLSQGLSLGLSLAGPQDPAQPGQGCPAPEAVFCRDLAAGRALAEALGELAEAAAQVGAVEPANPGRLLAQLREALGGRDIPVAGGGQGGVRVLRLEDAQGLGLRHVLAGGLNQGEFPQRPAQHLLSGPERLALGRRARLPVWRTEDEEYGGQVLRLLLLLGQAGQDAVLSCSAADTQGREQAPAFVLSDLAERLGRTLPAPAGGVYGDLPPLAQARDPLSLWGGLAAGLGRPGAAPAAPATPDPERELAQAALFVAVQRPGQARRWQETLARARVEEQRLALDLLEGPARLEASDPFGGRLLHPRALTLLGRALAEPERRRISASWLEAYAACPQAWFFGRLLGLAAPTPPGWDLERNQEGEWVHGALALFFAPAEFDPGWTREQRQARLADCLARAQAELSARGQSGHDQVAAARLGVIAAGLEMVVEREFAELTGEAAGLRPLAVEEELGPEAAGPEQGLALAVDDGPPLLLRGRLDRRDGNEAGTLVRVSDYKHTRNEARLRASTRPADLGVTAFQLPLYLAGALLRAGAPGAEAVGRVVPTALVGSRVGKVVYAPGDGFLSLDPGVRAARAAAGEPNLGNAIAGLWQRLVAGDLVPRPEREACALCAYAGLCRAQLANGAGEAAGNGQSGGGGEGGDA